MKLTLEKQIPLVFAIATLLLIIVVFFAFRSMNSLEEALKWENQTERVLLQLDETVILALDAESGGRGFLITADESFAVPYRQDRQKINETLNELRRLTADNPNQTEKLSRLSGLIDERLNLLGEAIQTRRTQNAESVRDKVIRGRDLMGETRLLINEMKDAETNLLATRKADLDQSVKNTYLMLYLSGFAGILSLGLANLAIFREVRRRRGAEDQLRGANKELEARVEKRTRQLSEKNDELTGEIERRKASEDDREELLKREQAARKEAEIANRLRDEFLATVSHELRAPLNSILGWGRLLEKGNLDETMRQKALNTIIRSAEAQNHLIEDLLDVSRIISGKLRLEVLNVKPVYFVESALETVRPAAEAKDITLELIETSPVSHIPGDPNRLQQVIWNLLSNAIKFTTNGGRVTVEIERAEGFVEIKIKDTGVGIKQEFLPHVFDRFRQADASSIRNFGGLGLGLSIVRHITEMHGGTVSVFSEGENQGSTFTVRLPAASIPQAEENTKDEETLKSSALENSAKLSLDGLLILVVDDEEDSRQLVVQSLTFYGATVITAKSAAEGLIELQAKNPDILVSDIGMPNEDGYSLISKIRALPDEHHKNIKAVALTGYARAQDRMRALSVGYQNHVAKPIEPDELATVVASLTGRLKLSKNGNS